MEALNSMGAYRKAIETVIARRKTGGGSSLLIDENCEGTGTPAGWVDVGSVNWDYTTTVLEGAQSMALPNSASSVHSTKAFSENGIIGLKMLWRVASAASATKLFITVNNSSGTRIAGVDIINSAGFSLVHGSAAQSITSAYSANVTYYVWFEYEKGTGSNGVARFYIDTVDIKPASPLLSTSSGTATEDAAQLKLGGTAFAGTHIYDLIKLDTSPIS